MESSSTSESSHINKPSPFVIWFKRITSYLWTLQKKFLIGFRDGIFITTVIDLVILMWRLHK